MSNNYKFLKHGDWITPNWPAPPNVKALTTLRSGGVSLPPYETFNLGPYVEDNPEAVFRNRQILKEKAFLPNDPFWLKQVHGTDLINLSKLSASKFKQELLTQKTRIKLREADGALKTRIKLREADGALKTSIKVREADGAFSFEVNQVCVVTTADCLPLLLCDRQGTRVSAVHAGWRGLAAGIIEKAIQHLDCDPTQLMGWLGPAIGPTAFEVEEDVLNAFQEDVSEETFVPINNKDKKWLANIYALAAIRLKRLGVTNIFGGNFCTYSETQKFYSFRREKITGRMATLIWLTST